MNRRDFVRTGALTVGLGAVAGCSDRDSGPADEDGTDESETDTDESTATATETATPDTETADARLRAASTSLSANNDHFSVFIDRLERDDEDPVTFDRMSVTDRLEGVREDLNAVTESGDQSQRAAATELRTLAEVQADAADGFGAFGTATVRYYEDVDSAVSRNQYGLAADELDGMESPLSEARSALDAARDGLAGVDESALADVSVEVDPLRTALEDVSERTDAIRDLIPAFRPFLEGTDLFISGLETYQNRRFGAAASKLSRAERKFRAASSRFGEVDAPPSDVDAGTDLSEVRCQTDAFGAAADYYERSADAMAADNRQRGKELAEQGEQALERCDSTSV